MMDTNRKRILLSASIVTTVAALSLAFVWQGGLGNQAATSTNAAIRKHSQVTGTDNIRKVRHEGEREIKPVRKVRKMDYHRPTIDRRRRKNKDAGLRVERKKNIPAM